MFEYNPRSIGKEKALEIYNSEVWKTWSYKEKAENQLNILELVMNFGDFHEAMENWLGRPIWTHEFADPQHFVDEYNGKIEAEDPFTSLHRVSGGRF